MIVFLFWAFGMNVFGAKPKGFDYFGYWTEWRKPPETKLDDKGIKDLSQITNWDNNENLLHEYLYKHFPRFQNLSETDRQKVLEKLIKAALKVFQDMWEDNVRILEGECNKIPAGIQQDIRDNLNNEDNRYKLFFYGEENFPWTNKGEGTGRVIHLPVAHLKDVMKFLLSNRYPDFSKEIDTTNVFNDKSLSDTKATLGHEMTHAFSFLDKKSDSESLSEKIKQKLKNE
jgi:hypothetical protein